MSLNAFLSDSDTATHRICGMCGEKKPLSHFYKHGKARIGRMKYRRECKECYKKTRMLELTRKGVIQDE